MFLSNKAQNIIESFRKDENRGLLVEKSSISDAMAIITEMHETHASTNREKENLINALFILASYNELLTELSKEK